MLILFAMSVAVVLRLLQSAHPMTFDEYASLYFSSRPFADLWGWWMLRETNPPLFYSVLKAWRAVVPDNQAALRALPCIISMGQVGLLARFAHKTYGWLAAVLCILLLALSPSDIFQSEYIRGYVLAKLAVTVSFIGLITATSDRHCTYRGWLAYAAGAVVAVYSHATMLAWPLVATGALFIDAATRRDLRAFPWPRLAFANLAIYGLSAWTVAVAVLQLKSRAQNIAWIAPLSLADYLTSIKLQLLLDGASSSAFMVLLMVVGVVRTWHNRVTRLSLITAALAVLVFKAADRVHPIISDYTMHWAAIFATLLGAAALAHPRSPALAQNKWLLGISAALTSSAVIGLGLFELLNNVWMPVPQDWQYTVRTVAHDQGAGLLVSHESVGLVVQQACRLEFHQSSCPFRLVVMENPARSDSWADGGYRGSLTAADGTPAALAGLRRVYAFSRYVYTPLEPLGLDPGDYSEVQWDDGELIGPIPIGDFARH